MHSEGLGATDEKVCTGKSSSLRLIIIKQYHSVAGSLTGRICNVQCDRVNLACLRCEKTGRKCDGHVPKNCLESDHSVRPEGNRRPHAMLFFLWKGAIFQLSTSKSTGPTISRFSGPLSWNVTIRQRRWSHLCSEAFAHRHALAPRVSERFTRLFLLTRVTICVR